MAGSNKPPAYGTREQVERDNQVWDRTYNPQSEQPRGTEAETQPDFVDVDTAKNAAMKDADPVAHSEGRLEDASLSALRIFSVGGLVASLGRDNLQPQTRTEATHDPTETGIYGHASNSDVEKQMEIANESMKLDSQGVPLSDGKIATIYSQIRADHLAEEKKRKDEEERFMAYVAAEAAADAIDEMFDFWDDDDDWYEPTMTDAEWEDALTQLNADNADFNIGAQQARDAIDTYLNDTAPANLAALQQADAGFHDQATLGDLHAQADAAPGTPDASAATAAIAARTNAAGLDADGHAAPQGSMTFKIEDAINSTSQAMQLNRHVNTQYQTYVNSMVSQANAMRDRTMTMSGSEAKSMMTDSLKQEKSMIQRMSGDDAKAALVARTTGQLERAVASGDQAEIDKWRTRLDNANNMTGDQARQALVREADSRIDRVREMSGEQAQQAVRAQAQTLVTSADQLQSQAATLNANITASTELAGKLQTMQTEYSRWLEEASRDGLSHEELVEQQRKREEIITTNNELAVLNGKNLSDLQEAERRLQAASANFELNGSQSLAARQALANTIQQAQSAALNAQIASDQAAEAVDHNADVTAAAAAPGVTSLDAAQIGAGAGRRASELGITPEQRQSFVDQYMALPADQKQDPATLARIQQSLHLTDDQSAFLVRRAQWDTPQKRAFIEEFNKLPPAQKQDPATLQALGQRAGLSAAELDHMTQRINERFQQGWNGQGDWQWGRGRGRPADSAQAPANPSINNAALAASPPANNLTTDAPNITADDALAMSLAPPKFDWSTGGASPSVPLFGFTPFNVTYVPVTPIADPGFSNDPKMSTDNGVTAGNYDCFCTSEAFTNYNPTPKDTGGVTPSYSKPWYSSAWDATTGFVSNIWASLDNKPATPASTDPLAQANPTMLAANSPNTTKTVPGASAGAGGGGLA
jgi:hypothetical protein